MHSLKALGRFTPMAIAAAVVSMYACSDQSNGITADNRAADFSATAGATSGLVAAYGFDEASGTTTGDASGNSNTGTLASGVTRTTGRFGGALSFNGTTGMVTVPNAPSLGLTSAMTLEAWVNPSVVVNDWRDIIYKANDNYYLEASSDKSSRPVGGGLIGGASSTAQAVGSAALAAGTWSHLAATYDGSTVRLYVNGALVSSVAKTGAVTTSTNPLTIGGDAIYGQRFKGLIDEVRIYSRALSATEIQTDMKTAVGGGAPPTPADTQAPTVSITSPSTSGSYSTTASTISLGGTASDNVGVTQVTWVNNRGGSGSATGTSNWSANSIALQAGANVITVTARDAANNTTTATVSVTMTVPTLPTGLVAAYGFNEASGTTTTDASGNSNTGTLGSGVTRTTGRFGSALSFDGKGGMVTVANAASLGLTSAMTLEAWVNPSTVDDSWRDVVYKANDNYYLEATSDNSARPAAGGLIGSTSSTTKAVGAAALTVGSWSHLAVTYDGSAVRLYVNGALVSSVAKTGALTTSTNPLTIGGDGIYGQYFQGAVDEVRIYSRALSAAEIATDMSTAVGGVAQPALPTDAQAPTLSITSPTTTGSYSTSSNTMTMSGTASDNVGVTQVTWTSSGGGSGTASGTTSWSVANVALQAGTNTITVTTRDAANNVASKTLTATYNAPAQTPVASQVAIMTQPASSSQSGATLAPQPAVQLRDASGNAVYQSGVQISAAIASGTGTMGGTTTASTNASGVATFSSLSITGSGGYTLRFSATGLTSATSNTITVAASGGGGGGAPTGKTEPTPAGTILLDTRAGGAQDIQAVSTLSAVQSYWAASGGSMGAGGGAATLAFTTNYNGAGKHALRVDWQVNLGAESSLNDITFYHPQTSSTLYSSVVVHLGKTATGGGLGSVGSFIPVTNGGGMKRMLWLRQKDNGTDRIYWNWPTTGQTSQQNDLTIDSRNFDSFYNADYGVGVDVRWTFELTPGSPGTLRVWRNGALVLENTNAGIGTLGFAEMQMIATRFNTTQAESEYWTDIVVWHP